ncbi:MAG: class I SAM-dependent methyltransferase [Acetobacteraceae bacterium]
MSLCAFDELARDYDANFTASALGRALREIVWSRLERTFGSCGTVLELGCGTGEDAVWLAGRGVRVLASDVSARMIQIARRKAESAGCADRIEFRCVPMQDLRGGLEHRSFDGVLSDFGAINCVRDLASLVADVSALVRPGGRLLWVVMGRYVPWEWIWYLSRGEWTKAWRRTSCQGVPWRGVTVYYPTPAAVIRQLRPAFRIDRLTPLGLALPPSYAGAWLDRSGVALALLKALETVGRRSSALAWLSDHYIIEATRS